MVDEILAANVEALIPLVGVKRSCELRGRLWLLVIPKSTISWLTGLERMAPPRSA